MNDSLPSGPKLFAKKISTENGFSLIEVVTALVIFSTFAVMFVMGQGGNLMDSTRMKEELLLAQLCEQKLNEIIVHPPELTSSLTLTAQTENFEKYPEWGRDLSYTVGEPGLAGHWMKLFMHYMFLYKAKARPGWSMIPE